MPGQARKVRKTLLRAIRNATVRYAGGVVTLLALGVAGQVWGGDLHLSPTNVNVVHGLSEAFLVSGVLALLVDPYLKRRLEDDSGWSAVFGYLNPKAPKELRDALQDLAVCQLYYSAVTCRVSFEWANPEKTILGVTLEIFQTGMNLDTEPYKPSGHPWVLASTDDWQSEYLHYSLNCPGKIDHVDVGGDQLQPYITKQDDNSLTIDEGAVAAGRELPSGIDFERRYRTKMYRHANGYVPFQHSQFTERLTVTLSGSALSDIDVRVTHPRPMGTSQPVEWKRESTSTENPVSRTFGRATADQVTLVSWYPVRNRTRHAER